MKFYLPIVLFVLVFEPSNTGRTRIKTSEIVPHFQSETNESGRRESSSIAALQVDASTLTGKVMCGYQGWFNCPNDGAGLGWTHWARNRREPLGPTNVTVDLWPDISELRPNELHETEFKLANGAPAKTFSSANRQTVLRHFEWMRDYEIDGAFLQRFANGLRSDSSRQHKDVVLASVREGAKRAGRVYAVMYDLSGLPAGGVDSVRQDWLNLRETMKLTQDAAYLKHDSNPVVAVWGIGFNDGDKPRKYTLKECRDLVSFLKKDGCTVMLGVPTGWRNLDRDSVPDPELHEVLKLADIVSPWTVGRYRDPQGVAQHAKKTWRPDIQWCDDHGLDYLPVVFPGFSWHNLTGEKLGAIPRQQGQFFWSQIAAANQAGAKMIYVAMFDEVDEGTAIFKCTNEPPVGEGVSFLSYEGLPSDYYLRLTQMAGKLLRNEIPFSEKIPPEMNATNPR